MDFSLTLNFNPENLELINGASQKVALAKPAGGSSVEVIWLAFDPFESNTVTWEENYWIYASTCSTAVTGEQITKLSEVQPGPAVDGAYYPFSNNATFGDYVSTADVDVGTYAAINNMSWDKYPTLTFGLAQSAMINDKLADRKPLSASTVLATQEIKMTPFTDVYIWLESHHESSTIITNITGNKTDVTFGGGVNDIAVTYDGKSGSFTRS